jgi:hypothetical protein
MSEGSLKFANKDKKYIGVGTMTYAALMRMVDVFGKEKNNLSKRRVFIYDTEEGKSVKKLSLHLTISRHSS